MTQPRKSDMPEPITVWAADELRVLRDWHVQQLEKLQDKVGGHRSRAQALDEALMVVENRETE